MNDLEKKQDEYPSTSTLSKFGINAVGCTAAGLFLIIMQRFATAKGPFGLIIGGIACVIGIISLLSKDSTDKKAGMLICGTGILVMLSKIPIIGKFTGVLVAIGAVGLIALGIVNAIKFFMGLRKRS